MAHETTIKSQFDEFDVVRIAQTPETWVVMGETWTHTALMPGQIEYLVQARDGTRQWWIPEHLLTLAEG